MALDREISGVILGFDNGFYSIQTEAAQDWLRILFLRPEQLRGASGETGTRVRLRYEVTPNSGLWYVISEEPA